MDKTKEALIELLAEYFNIGDSYTYNLTRVKSAFACGTMTFDDFEEFDAETIDDIVGYLIANSVTVQEWKPASEPPNDHKEYIVMIKGAKRPTTLWYSPKQQTWNEFCGDENYIVTHWKHLPQPPK